MSIAKSAKETIGVGQVVNLGQFVLYNDGTYRRLPNAKLIDIEFNEKHPGMLEFLVLEYKDGSVLKYKDGKFKASDAAGDAPKRRGRPPKAVASSDAPKRRGRPPKAVASSDAPKRRGRPPKAVLPEIKKPEAPAKKPVAEKSVSLNEPVAKKASVKKTVAKASAKKAVAKKPKPEPVEEKLRKYDEDIHKSAPEGRVEPFVFEEPDVSDLV